MVINNLKTDLHQLETEFYQSVMNKEIDPYLEQIEMILPDHPIYPIKQFRVLIKASGSDLPCNGNWFQISIVDEAPFDATIISQPQGNTISFGMTGEWHVELAAPLDTGDYWLQATVNSVETDQRVVKLPFTVKLDTPERKLNPSLKNPLFFSLTFLCSAFAIIWLIFSDPDQRPNQVKEGASKQALDLKTKTFVDEILEQSFNDASISKRQKAWHKLSQFINLQADKNTPYVRQILKKRSLHKQQMENWISSNKNPQESLKRLQVFAFAGDVDAQRRLGNYYASDKRTLMDLGKAWQWYHQAAVKGDFKSQQLLTELEAKADQLLMSSDINERTQGYKITKESAFAGGINAQLWMGYRYESGDGVNRNLPVAAHWYRKAAEQGNSSANEKLMKILDLIAKQKI